MSRGGRRRRTKRTNRPAGAAGAGQPQAGQAGPAEDQLDGGDAPRGRRESNGRQRSALESMRTLPTSVSTLPPDGLLLEELISNMQTEYGTPSTPQEYRLLVKVSPHEEAAPVAAPEPAEEAAPGSRSEAPRPPRSGRRRRRGRRRTGAGTVDGDVSIDEEGVEPGDDLDGAEPQEDDSRES